MPTAAVPTNELDAIRRRFPALRGKTILLENAGGSQVPQSVAERMRDYMFSTYVQLGAGYDLSDRCTQTVDEAHQFIAQFMNAGRVGKVVLGPSCTQLCRMIANCYSEILQPGDEIVISEAGHEANVGPWEELAKQVSGVKVRTWRVDPATGESTLDGLRDVLSERTKLVALAHVSNLLGEIVDVRAVTQLAHDAGARVFVDGVAYAPHRAIDVDAWGVDWYVYSTYKVYGPHMGALFGRLDAFAELTGPNHFFIPKDSVPYKFEPGGVSHEGCAGLLGLQPHLNLLAGEAADSRTTRATIDRAFDTMLRFERPLLEKLMDFLRSRPAVRIVGPSHARDSRVGTVSFLHASRSSAEIVHAAHAKNIGIRNGHMYAYRLCKAMGIDPIDGVVRVSFVHYNTPAEIDSLIEAIEPVLG